jgi:NTP pyrophosphatase (non-canonical NTP hydrolase)
MSWKPLWTIHTSLVEGTFKPGSEEDRHFLALAMCGEAGEVANLIKKQWRGDNIPDFQDKLEEEIGDVFAYLTLLSIAYGLRSPSRILDEVILPKIKARWPEHFKELP